MQPNDTEWIWCPARHYEIVCWGFPAAVGEAQENTSRIAENETTSHHFLSLLFHNSFTGRVSHAPTCTHRLATKTYNKKISDYNTHTGRVTSFSAPVYIFIGKNYLPLHYIRLLILTYRTFNRNLIILGPNCRFHEKKSEKLEICDFTLCQTFFILHLNFFPRHIFVTKPLVSRSLALESVLVCVQVAALVHGS